VNQQSIRVGGDEMDEAIVQYVKKAYNLLIGEQTAEAIKIKIGSAFRLEQEEEMEIKGRDLVAGIPKTMKISSVEVREALSEPLQQIVDALMQSLEKTPPELASDIVDRGIVMTGGGSLLRESTCSFAKPPTCPLPSPRIRSHCVVLGTGKILDDPTLYEKVLMSVVRD